MRPRRECGDNPGRLRPSAATRTARPGHLLRPSYRHAHSTAPGAVCERHNNVSTALHGFPLRSRTKVLNRHTGWVSPLPAGLSPQQAAPTDTRRRPQHRASSRAAGILPHAVCVYSQRRRLDGEEASQAGRAARAREQASCSEARRPRRHLPGQPVPRACARSRLAQVLRQAPRKGVEGEFSGGGRALHQTEA